MGGDDEDFFRGGARRGAISLSDGGLLVVVDGFLFLMVWYRLCRE